MGHLMVPSHLFAMQGLLIVTSATPVRGLFFFLERQLGLSAEVPARRILEAAFTSPSTNRLLDVLHSSCNIV